MPINLPELGTVTQKAPAAQRWLMVATVLVGLAAQVYVHAMDLHFAYADAVTRLDGSRRFFDSTTPGILNQLGTVWLPVPMLMMTPLSYFDLLWVTGYAGGAVCFVLYVATALAIFKMAHFLTRSSLFAGIAWGLYALNPNILYYQTVSLSEIPFLFFVSMAIYRQLQWGHTRDTYSLVEAGFFAMLAAGTRYEGWIFAAFAAGLVFLQEWRHPKKGFGLASVFVAFSTFFILFWMGYNWLYYGDLLAFQRGTYSSEAITRRDFIEPLSARPDAVLSMGNWHESVRIYLMAMDLNFGWIVLGFIILMLPLYLLRSARRPWMTLLLGGLVFIPFSVYALYKGQAVIMLPYSEPPGYFNSRYGLLAMPALCVAAVVGLQYLTAFLRRRWMKAALLTAVSALFAVHIAGLAASYPASVPAIAETVTFRDARIAMGGLGIEEYLADHYDGGKILVDDVVLFLRPNSQVPYKERVYPHSWDAGPESLQNPENHVEWVMLDRMAPHDQVRNALYGTKHFEQFYEPVYASGRVVLYRRKAP